MSVVRGDDMPLRPRLSMSYHRRMDEYRSLRISIRVTPTERARIRNAATAARETVSGYVARAAIDRVADDERAPATARKPRKPA